MKKSMRKQNFARIVQLKSNQKFTSSKKVLVVAVLVNNLNLFIKKVVFVKNV